MAHLVDAPCSPLAEHIKDLVTALDRRSEERIAKRVVRSLGQLDAVERTEAGVWSEALAARRALSRLSKDVDRLPNCLGHASPFYTDTADREGQATLGW
jgi:hypothetical protein